MSLRDGTKLNSVAEYTCSEGYGFGTGDRLRFCQMDGTWTGLEPECIQGTTVRKLMMQPYKGLFICESQS